MSPEMHIRIVGPPLIIYLFTLYSIILVMLAFFAVKCVDFWLAKDIRLVICTARFDIITPTHRTKSLENVCIDRSSQEGVVIKNVSDST